MHIEAQHMTVLLVVLLAACSRSPPPPEHLANIRSSSGVLTKGAFYHYKPGSILDEYLTLEINSNAERVTLVSISKCSWVGARISDQSIDIIAFRALLNLRSPSAVMESVPTLPIPVDIRSLDRNPGNDEIETYRSDGYTMIECKM